MNPAVGKTAARGDWAEQHALDFLKSQGLSLIARNFRCRQGEIDLVLRDGRQLVLAEVRYRARGDFGNSLESVNAAKQQRLLRAAQFYLLRHPEHRSLACRFDVLGVTGSPDSPVVEWIKDAFRA